MKLYDESFEEQFDELLNLAITGDDIAEMFFEDDFDADRVPGCWEPKFIYALNNVPMEFLSIRKKCVEVLIKLRSGWLELEETVVQFTALGDLYMALAYLQTYRVPISKALAAAIVTGYDGAHALNRFSFWFDSRIRHLVRDCRNEIGIS